MKDLRRPSFDEYSMAIANVIRTRSTCNRRAYGAVIVKDRKIVSTGYNGAPRGWRECLGGICAREQEHVPHGKEYERCNSVHAEQNAVISGNPEDMDGAVIYIACYDKALDKMVEAVPCDICMKMLVNAGIKGYINNTDGEIHPLVIKH